MRAPKATLLADLARARIARYQPEPWHPTEEQKAAIAAGTLIAIPIPGGPCVLIRPEGKHHTPAA